MPIKRFINKETETKKMAEPLSYHQQIEARTSAKLKRELTQAKKKTELYRKQVKKLAEELKKRDNDFLTVAENSPDVICRFDKKYKHIYVNPALEKTTGFPIHNFIGKTPHQAGLSPDFADFWVSNIKVVFDNRSPHSKEFSFPTPEGEKFFQTLLVPEFDSLGEVATVLSMTRDITEMKNVQTRQAEYLDIASHELKTPLTSLKAFTQLLHLKLSKNSDSDSAQYLLKMQHQIDKLNNLVSELLDSNQVTSGRVGLKYHKFNFDHLVKENVEQMQHTSAKHQIIVKGETNKYIIADKNKVSQVLINLLSNAIKYAPESQRIIVQLIPTADGVMCWVQDFGIGVPKDKQGRIFDRFFRVEKDKEGFPGLGLGLYICAEIIEMHGGKIWVNSEEGKGSTFCFTLPSQNLIGKKTD